MRSRTEAEDFAHCRRARSAVRRITYYCTSCTLIRQARGDVRHARCNRRYSASAYIRRTGSFSGAVDGKVDTSAWRFRPKRSVPRCVQTISAHAERIITQFTGLHVKEARAGDDGYLSRDLPLDTSSKRVPMVRGGVTGTLWASPVAIGHECDGICVIGTEGSLEWTATDCDHLIYTPRSQPISGCPPVQTSPMPARGFPRRVQAIMKALSRRSRMFTTVRSVLSIARRVIEHDRHLSDWDGVYRRSLSARPVLRSHTARASGWTIIKQSHPSLTEVPPVLKVQRTS